MLVLTRRLGEDILIGDNIRIRILVLGDRKVSIGIEAPTDIAVDRAEVRKSKLSSPRPKSITSQTLTVESTAAPAPYVQVSPSPSNKIKVLKPVPIIPLPPLITYPSPTRVKG